MKLTTLALREAQSKSSGGRVTADLISPLSIGDMFPAAHPDDLDLGAQYLGKIFPHWTDANDGRGYYPYTFLIGKPVGDPGVYLSAGTASDTDAEFIARAERLYTGFDLAANVAIGATSIDVIVADTSKAAIQDGDTLWLGPYASNAPADTGYERPLPVVSGVPTVLSSTTLRITLAAGLTRDHLAWDGSAGSRGGSGIQWADDWWAHIDTASIVNTSAAGTFDPAQCTIYGAGAVREDLTLAFTSATAYAVTTTGTSTYAPGDINTTYSPVGPLGIPAFSIPPAAFAGTWTAGDELSLPIYGRMRGVWVTWDIPAGSSAATQFPCLVQVNGSD